MNTLRHRLVSAGLVLVTLASAASPAYAVPPGAGKGAKPAPKAAATPQVKPVDVRATTKDADAKFKAGQYAEALALYETADGAKPSPELAFAIGECQDKLLKLREAVVAYERFLAAVPAKMKDKAEPTQRRVAEIKGMPGKVHLDTDPAGGAVLVDGKPFQEKSPTDLDLPPGKHTVRVELEGYEPVERDVEVAYAAKQDLAVTLEKKPEPPPPPPPPPPVAEAPKPAPPPPPPPPPPSKVPAYVTGGIAVAALGVGTGFGIAALSKSSDFKTAPTTSTADSGENAALVADMCFGIAITFGVTSAVLFLTKDPPKPAGVAAAKPAPARVSITPTPYITPQGGGAGALIRF